MLPPHRHTRGECVSEGSSSLVHSADTQREGGNGRGRKVGNTEKGCRKGDRKGGKKRGRVGGVDA